jgi:Short C-terminal domain
MKLGDKVRHAVYGIGVVEKIVGMGLTAEITVRFDESGVKRLTKAWAPLEVLHEGNENQGEPRGRVPSGSTAGALPVDSARPQRSRKSTKMGSIADQISVLFELYKRGGLTDEEFTAAKAELLKFDT